MEELVGNLLVAQSGGPTSVINASLAGVIQEAGRHDCIEEIYGGANGILGILNEELIDINDERNRTIDGLKYTPAAALGTCRYKIDFKKKAEKAAKDMDRLFQVFEAHNIRYFAYIGGNDSQDTSHKIHEEAVKRVYPLRVVGVPKTIDNDLPHTDNCPGYGSVIKYNAVTVPEVGLDVGAMATDDGSCCIIEVMGRSAGWIAAGTVVAKRGNPANPPHIILLPELPFEEEKFLAKVKETVATYKYCIVVVGEGIKDPSGQEVGADKTRLDSFGHPVLAGAAAMRGLGDYALDRGALEHLLGLQLVRQIAERRAIERQQAHRGGAGGVQQLLALLVAQAQRLLGDALVVGRAAAGDRDRGAHRVVGDHRAGDLGGAAQVVGGAGADRAERDLLRRPAAEQHRHVVDQLLTCLQVTVLVGEVERVAEGESARHD